jgi:hypothetical protein
LVRGSGGIVAEEAVEVAGAVEDAHDLDAVIGRAVQNEIVSVDSGCGVRYSMA